ncbi:MAG TPA: chloramphenicol phosphotransferase, partial [Chitinolyticbacter sp.]|nr:chloramphenicol phosphotransferase [Chitinolyticbacter sp.]
VLMQRGEPIRRRGYDWNALVRGYHYALPSLLQAGLKLIVDNAWCDREEIRELLTELAGYSVLLVGMHCDPVLAAARETARGDRAPGLSAWEGPRVHAHFCYDIEIDGARPIDQLVAVLMAELQSGRAWHGAHETLARLEMAG